MLREHARERVREIRVVPRALLGVTHHHEHLLARLVEQRRGWRNHGERTSGGEKRDLSKVARERAMRALGRGKRLAVEELQLDVVFPLRDAEVPQRREKRVHLVDRGNQSVRGVLREKHLSAVSRVGHHGDEVYRLAAEDGVMRVPVHALLPRAGLGGVDAHANARTAEDDVAVFVVRLREVGHPENLPGPMVGRELVLDPQAKLHGVGGGRERHLERVALGVDLVPAETLDALAHETVVHLLHEQHRRGMFGGGAGAVLDVRVHQELWVAGNAGNEEEMSRRVREAGECADQGVGAESRRGGWFLTRSLSCLKKDSTTVGRARLANVRAHQGVALGIETRGGCGVGVRRGAKGSRERVQELIRAV